MLLRSLLTLSVVILQLSACNDDPQHKAAIDEMDRRHAIEIERVGAGGGSGGM
jgi:hypothetical protein